MGDIRVPNKDLGIVTDDFVIDVPQDLVCFCPSYRGDNASYLGVKEGFMDFIGDMLSLLEEYRSRLGSRYW
jgi:hypothetical protein